MKDERWRLKDERWKMKDERWKIKYERWNRKMLFAINKAMHFKIDFQVLQQICVVRVQLLIAIYFK